MKVLKKECNPQTRLGGKMRKSTEAKTCCGEWSAEEWWNTRTPSFVLDVQQTREGIKGWERDDESSVSFVLKRKG